MRVRTFLSAGLAFLLLQLAAGAQNPPKSTGNKDADVGAAEREIRQFYDAYAEDLRQHRREAIADRYDRRGYFSMGNGGKQFVLFDDNRKRYMTGWTGPKSFAWKDLSIEVLSPMSATVIGLFDWQGASGSKATLSYTGVLTKESGQWRIRVEDESSDPRGYSTQTISGSRNTAGIWKYSLTAQPEIGRAHV